MHAWLVTSSSDIIKSGSLRLVGIYTYICVTFEKHRLVTLYAKKKHLGCKKGKANQKQQLSDYEYIHSYTCD